MIKLKTIYIFLFLVVFITNLGFSSLLLKNTIAENDLRERTLKTNSLIHGYYNSLTRGEFREFIEISIRTLGPIGLEEVFIFNKVDGKVLSSNNIAVNAQCVNDRYELCIKVNDFLNVYFKYKEPSFVALFSAPFIFKVFIQYSVLILILMVIFFWVLKFYSFRLIEFVKRVLLDEDISNIEDEYEKLREPVLLIKRNIEELEKENTDYEKKIAVTEIARKVAHDIKSPLGTLRTILDSGMDIDKELLEDVTNRINDISQDLLNKTRDEEVRQVTVLKRLESLVKQKEIETSREIIIEGSDSFALNCLSSDFDRTISNLINNAIDFSEERIIVRVEDHSISIIDNGKGIPEEMVSQLMESPRSWNKVGGNGVGLKAAKLFVDSLGGHLLIESQLYLGTTITLCFKKPLYIVHIDDDELVRITWKYKADKENINYLGFKSFEEFESSSIEISFESNFYVDFDLEYDKVNGLEVLEKLFAKGYQNLYLSTGHDPDQFPEVEYIKGILGKEAPF